MSAIEKAFAPALALAMKEQRVCIYGSGEIGILLYQLCRQQGITPLAFLDDHPTVGHCCGLPVHGVREGIAIHEPGAILLATIRAGSRMERNLASLPYTGHVLGITDPNAHDRSPHCRYTVTPPHLIRPFMNRHAGQRAFIIGNGPSLLKTDPRQLGNEITFASNNIFLLEGFSPTYYAVSNRILAQERAGEINALPWTKFFPHLLSEWITGGYFLNAISAEWPANFSTNISEFVEIEFTVTYFMLQIAFSMGCNPVYLIGMDHTYAVNSTVCHQEGRVLTSVTDDPNHFHPSYFGKGHRWTSPAPREKLDACFRRAHEVYVQQGRELFNASAGGALQVLPRVDFTSLISSPTQSHAA